MRVISGKARRTLLTAPVGKVVRPTSDRAKEAIFSIIAYRIQGARFLDLFCGSGAIGIEALSRGASHCVFVDSSKDSVKAVKANLIKTRLVADVIFSPAFDAIDSLSANGNVFDIIFLDPPYDFGHYAEVLEVILKLLSDEGIIVVETNDSARLVVPNTLIITDERRYGHSKFSFLVKV